MNVLIRADSSLRIGTGHVMRCLALADHLQRNGAQVRFLCRTLPGNINRVIAGHGFDVIELQSPARPGETQMDVPCPEYQNPDWEADAEATLAALPRERSPADWLIVDSYSLDAAWETRMRAAATRIMAIDDLANRPHDCDLLLDQNLNPDMNTRYDALVPADCRRLLGPRYALLRPEFRAMREILKPRSGKISRILLFFGGSDAGNATAKALLALTELAPGHLAVDVVVGAANPHRDALADLCKGLPQTRLHSNNPDMARLMADADLAIGAPGGTTWERCCLGLPAILVSLAANQEPSARALAQGGYAIYLGDHGSVNSDTIATAVRELLLAPAKSQTLSLACASLVDGRGTERTLRALDTSTIALSPAHAQDCERIYGWRNAEETRRHSHDPAMIPWERHCTWFEGVLRDPLRRLMIATRAGQPIGILRYDREAMHCTVSVYLTPGNYGRGYGPRILMAGHGWLRSNHPEVRSVRAEVLQENRASTEAFLQCGYRCADGAYLKDLN